MHWTVWPNILAHRMKGGLGFKDFRLFNQALLARQAWRLMINPHSLCVQVLKARYYPLKKKHATTSLIARYSVLRIVSLNISVYNVSLIACYSVI